MFHDLSDENWKNSPVMQIFAANFVSDRPIVSYVTQDVPVGPPTGPALPTSTADYEQFLHKQEVLAELDLLSTMLRKIATESGLNGQVKAAYEVERAIDEVDDIGRQMIEDSDA